MRAPLSTGAASNSTLGAALKGDWRVRIEVLYFAIVREKTGLTREVFVLPDGGTLRDLIALIHTEHTALIEVMPYVRCAPRAQLGHT